uniref:L-methionine (R)-S-oxide reductase n=1 Tax=Monodelphis domestica TaxID=13616 RepID=A0A5F8G8H0_MONDO
MGVLSPAWAPLCSLTLAVYAHIWSWLLLPRNFPSCLPKPCRPQPGRDRQRGARPRPRRRRPPSARSVCPSVSLPVPPCARCRAPCGSASSSASASPPPPRPPSSRLLPLLFASRFVGEDNTVMSAFNLLHLVTKSQPVAQRACGLPSGSCRDRKNCKVVFSQQELRKRLTPLQYHVTQEKGTESAFEGKYTSHKDRGMYKCVVCGTPLFK